MKTKNILYILSMWVTASLIAIAFLGFSDLFRKLASDQKDPYFINFIFQLAAFVTATILFMLHRPTSYNSREVLFACIGGVLISLATAASMRALAIGPGLSTVMPVIRFGGLAITAFLGILILKEKLTMQALFGFLFSVIGMYLLFTHK